LRDEFRLSLPKVREESGRNLLSLITNKGVKGGVLTQEEGSTGVLSEKSATLGGGGDQLREAIDLTLPKKKKGFLLTNAKGMRPAKYLRKLMKKVEGFTEARFGEVALPQERKALTLSCWGNVTEGKGQGVLPHLRQTRLLYWGGSSIQGRIMREKRFQPAAATGRAFVAESGKTT